MPRFALCGLALALAALALAGTVSCQAISRQGDPGEEAVPVTCPAVQLEGAVAGGVYGSRALPVSLVVMGQAKQIRPIREDSTDAGVYEVSIAKTLYGSWKHKTVRFSESRALEVSAPAIYVLCSTGEAEVPFSLGYRQDGSEEKWQVALAAARLDYNVLSSECIFVGREVASEGEWRRVEVVRSIYGPRLESGRKVSVDVRMSFLNQGEASKTLREEAIYFTSAAIQLEENSLFGGGPPDFEDEGKERAPDSKGRKVFYELKAMLPVELEPSVHEALARRDLYPIVVEEDTVGRKVRSREIVFRGSIAKAIDLMGSLDASSHCMVARMLWYKKDEARQPIIAAVEKDLLRFTFDPPQGYRRLQNLIRLLVVIGQCTADSDIGRLTDKLLAYIESNPPQPPSTIPRDYHYYFGPEDVQDVNHALAWLLQVIDREDVVHRFGLRLVRLRDAAKGRWKNEVQVAMDAVSLEDHMEVAAALQRSKDVTPLRGRALVPRWDNAIAFSPDGKFLRTIGRDGTVCLGDAATMNEIRRFQLPAGTECDSVRPEDGRYGLCIRMTGIDSIAEEPKTRKVQVVDLDAGKVVSEIELPIGWGRRCVEDALWLRDSQVLFRDRPEWKRFNYLTGKPAGQGTDPEKYPYFLTVGEDGKTLYSIDGVGKAVLRNIELRTVDTDTGKQALVGKSNLPDAGGNSRGLVPGGKYFYVGDPDLYIFDRDTVRVVGQRSFKGWRMARGPVFSPDGARYAVAVGARRIADHELGINLPDDLNVIRVHETLTGKLLFAFPSGERPALSLDGKRLAAIADDGTVEVWDLERPLPK